MVYVSREWAGGVDGHIFPQKNPDALPGASFDPSYCGISLEVPFPEAKL